MRCSSARLSFALLLHAVAGQSSEAGSGATTRFLLNQSLATSTCSGAFNTPCAITLVHEIVDTLVGELGSLTSPIAVASKLSDVKVGVAPYSQDTFFWTSVFDASGNYVASGRPMLDNVAGAGLVGQHIEAVAFTEAGHVQSNLWSRVVASAAADGYYDFLGYDGFHGYDHASAAAHRVGEQLEEALAKEHVAALHHLTQLAPLGRRLVDGRLEELTREQACATQTARHRLGERRTRVELVADDNDERPGRHQSGRRRRTGGGCCRWRRRALREADAGALHAVEHRVGF